MPLRRYDTDSPSGSGAGRRLFLVAATAALLLVIGVAIGRWSGANGPAPNSAAPIIVTTTSPASVSPPQADTGRRTRSGAIAAAAEAMTALARPELLIDSARRREVVTEVATRSYAVELTGLFEQGYDHMARRLGTADPDRVLMRLVPLAHRVEAFSPSRARVAVWQVLLLGAPGGRVVASWSTSRAELVWQGDRWRVARFLQDEPGPGPGLNSTATATPPEIFLARLSGLEPFRR